MVGVIVDKRYPECPLCLKKFKLSHIIVTNEDYLTCHVCRICIKTNDPCVGRWVNDEPVPCPTCGTAQRFFMRFDGYMKTLCPKCHSSIETKPDGYSEDIDPS